MHFFQKITDFDIAIVRIQITYIIAFLLYNTYFCLVDQFGLEKLSDSPQIIIS